MIRVIEPWRILDERRDKIIPIAADGAEPPIGVQLHAPVGRTRFQIRPADRSSPGCGAGVIRRHFTPEDRAASIYQYLPFEVPTTAAGFTVTLAYQRDPAIVDLGLVGPDRWGGWSGGERSEVTVTRQGDAWLGPPAR